VRSHPGTPDTEVTVPLLARYVAEQATIILQQISSPQDGFAPSVLADEILTGAIVCLEHQITCLRENLRGEQHLNNCKYSRPRTRSLSRASAQVASLAVKDAEQEIARIQLDNNYLQIQLSKD
jgi:hypothetical protein